MSNSDRTKSVDVELDMFLDLSGQSDGTNQQISASSVNWWSQIGLVGPRTYQKRAVSHQLLQSRQPPPQLPETQDL